jgi:hypothetical protein
MSEEEKKTDATPSEEKPAFTAEPVARLARARAARRGLHPDRPDQNHPDFVADNFAEI